MHREPVVKIGDFGQGVRGDQPDFHAAGIGDADEIEVGINISGGQSSDALLVRRRSFLWRSLRLIADQPQVAGKCAVHHNLQLGGEFLSLRRALGVGHLQILRGSGVVSRLRGLEKSVYGAVGSVTAQWVRWGRRLVADPVACVACVGSSCPAAATETVTHKRSQQARLKKKEDMVPSPEEGRELMRIMRPRKMPERSESSLYRKGSQPRGIGLSSYGRLGR